MDIIILATTLASINILAAKLETGLSQKLQSDEIRSPALLDRQRRPFFIIIVAVILAMIFDLDAGAVPVSFFTYEYVFIHTHLFIYESAAFYNLTMMLVLNLVLYTVGSYIPTFLLLIYHVIGK